MFRKLRDGLLATVAAGAFVIAMGSAKPVLAASLIDGAFSSGENNLITDESGETSIDTNANSLLDTGDALIGALDFFTVSNPTLGTTVIQSGAMEYTAYFQIGVAASADTGTDTDAGISTTTYDIYDFNLAPLGASFWTSKLTDANNDGFWDVDPTVDLSKVVAIIYEDSGAITNFDRTGSAATELADASDGTIKAILTLDPASGDFWIASGPQVLAAFGDFILNTDLGDFFFGLTIAYEDFGPDFLDAVTITSIDGSNTYEPALPTTVFAFGDGDLIARGAPSATGFAVYDKVDVTVFPVRVPEPASLGMLGVGLIALGIGARRRRRRSN
jgi:hypothetical protein